MRTLFLFLLLAGFCVASEVSVTLPSGKEINLTVVDIPVFRESEKGTTFGDVLSHSKDKPFGAQEGRGTNVHETAHGIHSYLRNKYEKEFGGTVGGFYMLEGRGIIFREPNLKRSQVKDFVPKSLRETGRFQTYVVNPPKKFYIDERGVKVELENENPLMLTDEWVAYILGGMTHVEDYKNGKFEGMIHQGKKLGGGMDAVKGAMDFAVFNVALCMAIEKHDPDYWRDNKQFRDFMELMLNQSYDVFQQGHVLPPFQGYKQAETLELLQLSPDCSEMRDFLRNNFGGIWLK